VSLSAIPVEFSVVFSRTLVLREKIQRGQCISTAKDAGTNGLAVGAQRIPWYFQVWRSGCVGHGPD